MNNKKTILYLRTDIGAENLTAGGSVAHTLGVIRGFSSLGYSIVAASSAMIEIMQQLPLTTFVPLGLGTWTRYVGHKISCLISNITFYVQTKKLLKDKYICFIYQRYSLLNIVGLLLSWRTKIPLVLEFNGSEVWVDEYWSKNRIVRLRWLVAVFERWNVRYAHTILVVSQALKDALVEQGVSESKILVHPNGVDPTIFDPVALEDKRTEIRSSLGLQDCVVFGFIGTFSYWHGIEVIGEIIPEVVKKWPTARFLLIGDGMLRLALQRRLEQLQIGADKVIFLGTVPQQQAYGYLAACDAFLSPIQPNSDGSRFFGSPTKLFEYMSLAKPIIASNIEQLAQVLAPAITIEQGDFFSAPLEGRVGILVEPHDVAGFIKAVHLVMMYTDHQRNTLGTNARCKVLNNYTWKHHTSALITWLSED